MLKIYIFWFECFNFKIFYSIQLSLFQYKENPNVGLVVSNMPVRSAATSKCCTFRLKMSILWPFWGARMSFMYTFNFKYIFIFWNIGQQRKDYLPLYSSKVFKDTFHKTFPFNEGSPPSASVLSKMWCWVLYLEVLLKIAIVKTFGIQFQDLFTNLTFKALVQKKRWKAYEIFNSFTRCLTITSANF